MKNYAVQRHVPKSEKQRGFMRNAFVYILCSIAVGVLFTGMSRPQFADKSWSELFVTSDSEQTRENKEPPTEDLFKVTSPALPEDFTLYADDEEVFRLAAFEPHGFDVDAYTPLPQTAVESFNSKVLPALVTGSFPLAATALLAHPRLYMNKASGALAPAAAGTGFRGIVKGAGGRIIGQGLFTTPVGLMITGGALTVGSLAFAMTHKSDTDRALIDINQKVDLILTRMNNELLAEIESKSDAIRSIKAAAEQGDFDVHRRQKLEDFETELHKLAIQTRKNVYITLKKPLKNDSTGSAKTYQSALDKYEELRLNVAIHNHVVNLRMLNWYVRALHPGKNSIVEIELDKLRKFLGDDQRIETTLYGAAKLDQEAIRSFWNKTATLEERRKEVAMQVEAVGKEQRAGHQRAEENLALLQELTASQNGASEFVIEMKDGKAVAIYQAK